MEPWTSLPHVSSKIVFVDQFWNVFPVPRCLIDLKVINTQSHIFLNNFNALVWFKQTKSIGKQRDLQPKDVDFQRNFQP